MNATVNIICYKQKKLKNGQHPLMIRVTKNRKVKYKSIGISVLSEHWDFEKNRPKPKCPNKELILKIILEKEAEFQREILELTSMQKEYSASSLISSKSNQIQPKDVGDFYLELIEQYKKVNRLGYARSHRYSWNSLKRFCTNDLSFPFSDIDVDWLKKHEQWLKDCNCSEVTIAILFRTLRGAYNKTITAKYAHKSAYPFNDFKVSKFDTSTDKRALPKESIRKIMDVDLSKER